MEGNDWRSTCDDRRSNAKTNPDRYLFPHIQDLTAIFKDMTLFRKSTWLKHITKFPWLLTIFLKLLSSPLAESTGVCMPFGLRNAAQTIQRFVDDVFRDSKTVHAYVDDCLIGSSDRKSYLQHLDLAFERPLKHSITVNIQNRAQSSNYARLTPGSLKTADARFGRIHRGLVESLRDPNYYSYLLTCADRFTRWPEAVPINNIDTETVVVVFFERWVANFGCSPPVTTDRERHFEPGLYRCLATLLGITRSRATAYYPQANGSVGFCHR
ncbi:unnamed protein product [Schistosoma mattheei]|uniref:Uncharacterized protein n=1 Tax=Schistosoma mattheei TaxID=31246 RepID=A0A183NL48_9TREM|nr:unnamed protein product [Schistosoma mattheei]